MRKIIPILFLLLFMASIVSAFNWNDKTLYYYNFDNNVNDQSGNGRNGVATSLTYTTGKIGNAGSFDGLNSYVTSPFNLETGNPAGKNYSISFWMKSIDTGADNALYAEGNTGDAFPLFRISQVAADDSLEAAIRDNAHTSQTASTTGDYTDGAWHHVVFMKNDTQSYRIFIDGTLKSSGAYTLGIITTNTAKIGAMLRTGVPEDLFNGQIDEFAVFNRSLTTSEVSELYNSGNGLPAVFSSISVTLSSPGNGSKLSQSGSNFTANYSMSDFNITNATYFIWNSSSVFNSTMVSVSGNTTNTTTLFIDDFNLGETYKWNVYACGMNLTGSSSCFWSALNYTFYNAPFSEVSTSYNQTATETSYQGYRININANPLVSSITGKINYDGRNYTSTIIDNGGGSYSAINNFDVPLIDSTGNKSFYWILSFTLTNGVSLTQNTNEYNQTVTRTDLSICNSVYKTQFINFTTRSAENPFPIINATFKSAWNWYVKGGDGSVYRNISYEDVSEQNSTFSFCMSPNQTYIISSDIETDASLFAMSSYYLSNAEVSNSTQAINIYLLNDSKSTVTVLRVRDSIQSPKSDVIIQIQLYDVGTDRFYTVGMAKTSFLGEDLAYLNWYNSLYRFILIENGDVILSTNTSRISESPVIFDIDDSITFGFDKFRDFQYSLTFNNATKNFVLTFTKPSGLVDMGCLRVIKRTPSADTQLALVCETSSSATLYYNIGSAANGTYIASFYATGSLDTIDWITVSIGSSFSNQINTLLGEEDSTAYAIFFSGIVMALMFVNPIFAIIGVLAGTMGAAALGFTGMDYGIFIGLSLVGGFIIWIIRR